MYEPLHTNKYILDLCKLEESVDHTLVESLLDEETHADCIAFSHEDDFAAQSLPSSTASSTELNELFWDTYKDQQMARAMAEATSADLIDIG